ncbi:MAG: hypothetical protein ACK51S_04135 [Alphaproteobacteria bacterium]
METLGTLKEVSLREAWPDEARHFTPWLAKNLHELGRVLGIELELVEAEAGVQEFWADILARNPKDDRKVLIENQLEKSDHTHLGQILTYLAGLEASTIVWVAKDFSDAHLSAVSWLNENTKEPFSFFAVKVKAVRIGESPIAPVFEVVERPNDWDRRLQEQVRRGQLTPLGQMRRQFWLEFVKAHPSEGGEETATAGSSRWQPVPGTSLVVAQYLAAGEVGVFVRGGKGTAAEDVQSLLLPHRQRLEAGLGAPMGAEPYFFSSKATGQTADQSAWQGLAKWLHEQTRRYVSLLQETLGAGPAT